MTEPSARNMYIIKYGLLGMIIAAYHFLPGVQNFIITGINFLRCHDYDGLREFILSYGVWAPITSIALMAIQSMIPLVPGLFITITNAWMFGWQQGAIYSWLGALLGATLDFAAARWYGRPVVERYIYCKFLNQFDCFLQRHGILAVFITRLTPVIPFKMVSCGSGLTAMPFRHFILATGIGQTPAIVLYSILGQNLTYSIRAVIAITSLLILTGIFVFYYRDAIERYIFCNKDQ